MWDEEEVPAHLAPKKTVAGDKLKPAPFQSGEQIEMRLRIALPARQVKGQGREFDPAVQTKAALCGRLQQNLLGLEQLAGINQHVNIIGGEMRQALVVAQDETIDPRLVPGAKDGGNQLADFLLLGHLAKERHASRPTQFGDCPGGLEGGIHFATSNSQERAPWKGFCLAAG